MDASIIIPTYERLPFLKRTLQTLTGLTSPRDTFEVIVIDDGSTDETCEFLSSASFPFQFRFFRHPENRFAAAARNTGIKRARGDIVVFLDDDMEVVPTFLEEHLTCQQEKDRMAVVGNIQISPRVTPTGMIRYLSTRGVHKLKLGQPMPFHYWCSGNASVKKSILLDVGLFDEDIRHYGGEDLELSCRFHKRGDVFFHYASRAISYHMHFRKFDEVCQLMFDYGRTSLAYIIDKHPELAKTVKSDLMAPIQFGRDRFLRIHQKMALRIAMNPVIYGGLHWCARHAQFGLPAFIYDYVIAYNYLRGLRKAVRKDPVKHSTGR